MTTSLLKSLSKILLLVFLIALVLAVFNLPLIFKRPFLNAKALIEKNLGEKLDKKVTIGSIKFFPYGELILNKVRIEDENDELYADVKKCSIRFKILPLITRKTVVVSQLAVSQPVIFGDPKDLAYSLKKSRGAEKYAVEVDKYVLLKLTSGKLVFSEKGSFRDEIGFDLWTRLVGGDKFYSKGSIDLTNHSLRDYILNDLFFFEFVEKIGYDLKASIDGDTLSIEDLLLDFKQFKLSATGTIEEYTDAPLANLSVTLKDIGFTEKTSLRSRLLITSVRNFIAQIKGALKEPTVSVKLDELKSTFGYLPTVLNINNFYCNVKLSKEEFIIEECSCFLNNFPIGLKARYSLSVSPHIGLNIRSHPGQVASLRPFNPLNFEFSFAGDKLDDCVKGDMGLVIDRSVPGSEARKSVKLQIEALSCGFSDMPPRIFPDNSAAYLSIATDGIICETNISHSVMRLDIDAFRSLLYPKADRIYFDNMNVSAYGGSLDGSGFLELKNLSPHFVFDFGFEDFRTAELIKVLSLKHDLAGDLGGKAHLDTNTFAYMTGKATVSDGHIKNSETLNLISDFLSIPSLKEVYFEDCSSDFTLSPVVKEVKLDNLKLHSSDISLDADLSLGDRQKINGHILIRLSSRLLRESLKMRLLFLLLGEGFPYADFEFKIGGFVENPHIKWLDTKFRQTIMRYLSKGGQKAIEKQVENAIKPLLENK